MSLLYKPKNEQTMQIEIEIAKDKSIFLDFYSDCGKFGTIEYLAGYKFSPERLLQIIQETELLDEEFN